MTGSYLLFALRRTVAAALIAVAVSAVTFLMLHVLRPESFPDPRPLLVELADFLWSAVTRFDLGRSALPPFRPVADLVLEGLPADLSLFAGALVAGVVGGVAGGVACARRPRSLLARALRLLALLALCAPVYWTGLLVVLLVGSGVGWLAELPFVDTGAYRPLHEDPLAWLGSLVVPWLVTGAPLAAICLRMTESGLREVQHQDFLRTALAKGLSDRAVAFRHALPAAISPTLSISGAYTPMLVGNALLVEQVFNIPGVFRVTPSAIAYGDFPVLQGLVIVGALMVVVGNLAADLLLARLDPRIRTGPDAG